MKIIDIVKTALAIILALLLIPGISSIALLMLRPEKAWEAFIMGLGVDVLGVLFVGTAALITYLLD